MAALEDAAGARVAFLTRYGDGLLPTGDTVVQEGDLVHVIMRIDGQPLGSTRACSSAAPEAEV